MDAAINSEHRTDWRENPIYEIGRCATIQGDANPWMIIDYDPCQKTYEVSCTAVGATDVVVTPLVQVSITSRRGTMCEICVYKSAGVCAIKR